MSAVRCRLQLYDTHITEARLEWSILILNLYINIKVFSTLSIIKTFVIPHYNATWSYSLEFNLKSTVILMMGLISSNYLLSMEFKLT